MYVCIYIYIYIYIYIHTYKVGQLVQVHHNNGFSSNALGLLEHMEHTRDWFLGVPKAGVVMKPLGYYLGERIVLRL